MSFTKLSKLVAVSCLTGSVLVGGLLINPRPILAAAPTGSVSIDFNAPVAINSATVELTITMNDDETAPGDMEMRISEDNTFGGGADAFIPFATSAIHNLSTGTGTKTIYVQFRDEDTETTTVSDTIVAHDIPEYKSLYRFWSSLYKHHFYTLSETEKDNLVESDPNWTYERIEFESRPAIQGICLVGIPVYRFYSAAFKSHFYTTSSAERVALQEDGTGWSYEGVAYCVYSEAQTGRRAVHRYWSSLFKGHFFTSSAAERANLESDTNWTYEGVGFYSPNNGVCGDDLESQC